MGRDVILEGAGRLDIEQLRLLDKGLSTTASQAELERIEAKGWLETVDGTQLITLTGRTLLERPPFNLD